MKTKWVVLVVVLLLVAMIPALVMAQSQAKPEKMVKVSFDIRQPIGPQLDAQLGRTPRGPQTQNAPVQFAPRGPQALGIQPQAVYGLLNEGFEAPGWPSTIGGAPGWSFGEFGGSAIGWDSTDYLRKRGAQSLWAAGYGKDPYVDPTYDNDMYSWAWYDMDLQGARRVQVRFQFMNDSEFEWDYFLWCGSSDGFFYVCEGHTGSTAGKWQLVKMDSRNNTILSDMLDSPFASWAFIFYSDSFCCTDRGAFVDALRIRAWGPSPSN